MLKVSPEELTAWSDYIASLCGIRLDRSKGYLIENRLGPLAESLGCPSFQELLHKARTDFSGHLKKQVIERITTRETSFFRDSSPFSLLQNKLLPELIDRAGSRSPFAGIPIRIWSAACSSGQEVYTIAIVLRELLGSDPRYRIRILGTDISNEAIASASRGEYDPFEIDRGMPPHLRQKYFLPLNGKWKINDEIRSMASFSQLNLLEDFSRLGSFDIIFCRNVAIYFSEKDKVSLFNRIAQRLDPHGALIVGSTESIAALCPVFQSNRHLRSVYYSLNPDPVLEKPANSPRQKPSPFAFPSSVSRKSIKSISV
jgi:chemotaxis protein methyltransferase CheR